MPIRVAAPPNARSDCSGPGDDERARAFAEQERLARRPERREVDRAAEAARQARLGQRDGKAALGDVVGGAQRARADGLADRGVQRAELAEVGVRELAPRRLAAELRQLGAGGGRRPGAGGDDRDDVALLREAEATGPRRPSGSSPTRPTTGVGKIGPAPASL